jgi:hypothetical protein
MAGPVTARNSSDSYMVDSFVDIYPRTFRFQPANPESGFKTKGNGTRRKSDLNGFARIETELKSLLSA